MLALCAFRRVQFSVIYLAVFLWLGVWVKMVAHQTLDYQAMFAQSYVDQARFGQNYIEPIGEFDFSPGAWKDVIWTVTTGGIGVLTAVGCWLLLTRRPRDLEASWELPPTPRWYAKYRWFLWAGFGTMFVAMVLVNQYFGLFEMGWRPKVVLPWPLSGLFPWFFWIGAALIVAVLAGWDRTAGHAPWTGLAAAATEAVLSAGTIMSRSIFLFHAGAYLVAILRDRSVRVQFRFSQTVAVVCAFCVLFAASLVWVTYARYLSPASLIREEAYNRSVQQLSGQPSGHASKTTWREVIRYSAHSFLSLAVDRWIGLEGVMVLAAHQDKSWKFFIDAAKERRSLDRVDPYTRISRPSYDDAATAIYHYGANPGAIGFLYFSGSRLFVFFGMFGLTVLAMVSETVVRAGLRNPYTTSLVALYVVSMIISLNPGLFQKFLSWITTLVACLMLAAVSRQTRGSFTSQDACQP
jgi:hypothetical protein